MTTRLQTSQVFLDTQVFISSNFQFSSGRLKRLSDLSREGRIQIWLTDIIVREIKENLLEQIQEACKAIEGLQRKARVLRNSRSSSFREIFDFDEEAIKSDLIDQFNVFLASAQIGIISTKNVAVDTVFEKYFMRQPPFGEGKKKSEFPDAFSIAALEKWCQTHKSHLYVISDDEDIKSACIANHFLLHLRKAEELFDLIASEDEYISNLAQQCINHFETRIKERISEQFQDLDFWLINQEGEVNEVRVDSVDFLEKYLVEVIDNNTIYVQIITSISFSVNVSYPDPEMTVYDSENGELIVLDTVNKNIERVMKVPVEVEICSDDELRSLYLGDINLDVNESIEIRVNDGHVYGYKYR